MKQVKVTSYTSHRAADPRDMVARDLLDKVTQHRVTAALSCRRLTHIASRNVEAAGSYTASFSHPSPRNNAALRVLHDLYERVELLRSLVDHINHGFDGWDEIEPVKVKAQSTLTRLSNKVDAAIEKLSRCSERHQPEAFKKIVTAVDATLQQKFAGRFSEARTIALVRVVENEHKVVGTQFTSYICIRDFQDDNGYVYPSFHVVLTCLVGMTGRFSVNVCTQPQMILPGRFKAGTEAGSIKQTVAVTLEALAKHGFHIAEEQV